MTRFGLGFQGKYNPTPAELADLAAGINGNDQYTKLLFRTTHNAYDASVPSKGNATWIGGTTFSTSIFKFSGSSIILNGTDAYVQFPDHVDWAYGYGDFTIEGWIYIAGAPSIHHGIVTQNVDNTFTNLLGFYCMSDNSLVMELRIGSASSILSFGTAPGVVTTGVWTHVALERYGSAWTMYRNGVAVGAASYSGIVPDFAAPLTIGELQYAGWRLKGNVSEIRISKGIARFRGNFTPPTGPYQYESIGGNDNFTKLMLHLTGTNGQITWPDFSPYGVATPPTNLNIEHLTIAGGGGGGGGIYNAGNYYSGGGGGAGGYTSGAATLGPGNYGVAVGGGGAGGGIGSGENGYQGGDGGWSQFWTLPAAVGGGGGGGAGNVNASPGQDGRYGGSGGGGGGGLAPGGPGAINYGGPPQAGQGNAGANGQYESPAWGGGGGGAGGGGNVPNAGPGFVSSMNGTAVTFCQGGYAGYSSAGANYQGWGGNGGHDNVGGAGGIGTVIVRYLGGQKANGGSITSYGGYTAHTFYGSGTFTVIDTSEITGNKGWATRAGSIAITQGLHYFNGSSTYFNGTDGYLQYNDSPDWTADTDWTLDVRVYLTAWPTDAATIASQVNTGSGDLWLFTISPTGAISFLQRQPGDTGVGTAAGVIALNTWYHIALVRSGTNATIYVNGVATGAAVVPLAANIGNPGALQIGRYNTSYYKFIGYMSEFRISKGAGGGARWTANFTPPRAPYGVQGNDGYTQFLFHADGAVPTAGVVVDSSKHGAASQGGQLVQSHSLGKWGNCFYFPGNSWIQWTMLPNYKLGGGDFTIDWWQYQTTNAGYQSSWAQYNDGNNRVGFFRYEDGSVMFQVYISSVLQVIINTYVGAAAINTYYHYAVVRSGNTWTLYQNGIAIGTTVSSYVIPDVLGAMWFGGGAYAGGQQYPYYGLIDEFRLSNKARWLTNFVPPAIPYYGVYGSVNTVL